MDANNAIDMLGWLVRDVEAYRRRQLTGEHTADDVRETVRGVLAELMDREPTDEDCQAVMDS